MTETLASKEVKRIERAVVRIAGDSGDGMQLTGDWFTQESASFGNDLSTLPNFPAEIRAPQGTLAGVSSFQLHFADYDILTPGDRPDVLVAMNPAALKANLGDMPAGGTIVVDTHGFNARALAKIGWAANPLEDGTLENYLVHAYDITQLTLNAVEGTGLSRKAASRSKNMFALGLLFWMYSRPTEAHATSSAESSHRSPTFWPRTLPLSRPDGTSVRRPRPSRSAMRSSPLRWPPGRTETSQATRHWPTA